MYRETTPICSCISSVSRGVPSSAAVWSTRCNQVTRPMQPGWLEDPQALERLRVWSCDLIAQLTLEGLELPRQHECEEHEAKVLYAVLFCICFTFIHRLALSVAGRPLGNLLPSGAGEQPSEREGSICPAQNTDHASSNDSTPAEIAVVAKDHLQGVGVRCGLDYCGTPSDRMESTSQVAHGRGGPAKARRGGGPGRNGIPRAEARLDAPLPEQGSMDGRLGYGRG